MYRWVDPPFTFLMAKRKAEAWRGPGKDSEIHYTWVDWKDMSGAAPLAMMAAEDQKLPFHHGFDFESINKAVAKNKKGKKIRGGSTISQQVAKNAFLWPGRSWVRKGFEPRPSSKYAGPSGAFSKYCNIAETGERTFGVEAAAQRFMNKPATKLSLSDGALIASDAQSASSALPPPAT